MTTPPRPDYGIVRRPVPYQEFGPVVPRFVNPLPGVPTEYHQFWRSERYRWWRPLLVLLSVIAAWLLVQVVVAVPLAVVMSATGQTLDLTSGNTTKEVFLLNNVMIAAVIPLAMWGAWVFTGQRPKWLASVVGGLRWRWIGRVTAVVLPVFLVYTAVQWWLSGIVPTLGWTDHALFMILTIVITTPFQAAGEEYLIRGVLFRAVASWVPARKAALVVATAVSAIGFMLLHVSTDPWLIGFYLLFGVCACVLTWRTGGLEAAIVVHLVNNFLAEATLPFSDMSKVFDRHQGTGSPALLIDMAVLVVVTLLVLWVAKRSKVESAAAFGADGQRLDRPATPVNS